MNNIVLIGMPACGKSTFGVVLAKTLGMSFVDTDLLIQEEEETLLQTIINERGMEEFLQIEERVLSHVSAEHTVIATGGSAVYSDKAMNHLGSIGRIVYIRLPLEEIEARLDNIQTRGIAMSNGETIADLYHRRTPLYEKYADVVLETGGLTLEESVTAYIDSFTDSNQVR